MKKYLVDVYLPAVSKHYDVYLPSEKQIGEATKLLVGLLESLSNGSYKGTADAVLLNAETGLPLNRNGTALDAGIRNGSKLILV